METIRLKLGEIPSEASVASADQVPKEEVLETSGNNLEARPREVREEEETLSETSLRSSRTSSTWVVREANSRGSSQPTSRERTLLSTSKSTSSKQSMELRKQSNTQELTSVELAKELGQSLELAQPPVEAVEVQECRR